MTEFQHAIVGCGILLVLWHFFIKRYFVSKKDVLEWQKIIQNYFFYSNE